MASRKLETKIRFKYDSKVNKQCIHNNKFEIPEEINDDSSQSSENRREKEESQLMCSDFKQKVLTKLHRQLTLKKEINNNTQNKLSILITGMEAVDLVFEQQIQGIKVKVATSLDAFKKAKIAIKQRIQTLYKMHKHFKAQCNVKAAKYEDQIAQLEKDLYEETIKIKTEVHSQTKESNFKMMLSILKAVQDNM